MRVFTAKIRSFFPSCIRYAKLRCYSSRSRFPEYTRKIGFTKACVKAARLPWCTWCSIKFSSNRIRILWSIWCRPFHCDNLNRNVIIDSINLENYRNFLSKFENRKQITKCHSSINFDEFLFQQNYHYNFIEIFNAIEYRWTKNTIFLVYFVLPAVSYLYL